MKAVKEGETNKNLYLFKEDNLGIISKISSPICTHYQASKELNTCTKLLSVEL